MSDDNCKFFIKRNSNKSAKTRQIRRKSSSEENDSSDDDQSSVVHVDRKKRKPNPMIQSTHSYRKKINRRKMANDSDDKDDDDDDDNDNDAIHVNYASTKSAHREGPADMGATMTLETETERDKDAQSIFERARRIQEEMANEPDNDNDSKQIYHGANNYQQFKQKKDTPFGNASSGHVRRGPMRAPDNIRSTVRWDYQPDICKDYKETGFCGFGDSCKFLHDRSDYKAGWQLELEEAKQSHHHNHDEDGDDDPDKYKINDDDDLPFACFICRERFINPVVTKCKHYFCQRCALEHYKKSTRCFVCSAQTSGVFNMAKDIEKRMKLNNTNNQDTTTNDDDVEDDHSKNENQKQQFNDDSSSPEEDT